VALRFGGSCPRSSFQGHVFNGAATAITDCAQI
jgi:hypothetical protein